ncbi:hypothetical protein Taro_010830, partial [Colocasia esculenta]|nr:hypothetical protein [Colocasia esculenta]
DVLEREWLSRRLVRRLETLRHHSRRSLCHRTHIVVLLRCHLHLRWVFVDSRSRRLTSRCHLLWLPRHLKHGPEKLLGHGEPIRIMLWWGLLPLLLLLTLCCR